jgi:hypothetical protein
MYGSEWWSFELVSLLAGRLGEASIAAQAAITSSKSWLFQPNLMKSYRLIDLSFNSGLVPGNDSLRS